MRHAAFLGFLTLIVVALYAPTFDDELHLDDPGELAAAERGELSGTANREDYRGALSLMLWRFDLKLFGKSLAGFHATNIAIHALNAILVYAIVWSLGAKLGAARFQTTCIAAVLFAAHPFAVATVAYLTQRSTLIAATSVLAATWGWITFLRVPGPRRWLALATAAAACFAGAHAKHVAMLAPVFAVSAGMIVTPRRPRLGLAVSAFGLLLLVSAPRMIELATRAGRLMTVTELAPAPNGAHPYRWHVKPRPSEYVLTQAGVVASYACRSLVPIGLSIEREVVLVTSPGSRAFLVPALALAALALGAFRLRKSRSLVTLGVSWFFLGVLPTSSFIPSRDLSFDHRAYVSLAGVALLAAATVEWAWRRWPGITRAIVATILVVFAAATARRVAVWDTELSLWTDCVAQAPTVPRARVNLGGALERAGRPVEAEAHYRAAIAIEPTNPVAWNNLGNVLGRRGALEEAQEALRAAMAADPLFAEPLFNLGNLAMARADYGSARSLYERAAELGLDVPAVRANLRSSIEMQALRLASAESP